MAIEKVLITIRGGSEEKKLGGGGEGKEIMAIKRFLVTIGAW
jgi:hypothetical protein